MIAMNVQVSFTFVVVDMVVLSTFTSHDVTDLWPAYQQEYMFIML